MNKRIEDNEFEEVPFNIRYDNVMKHKDFLPITRILAMDLSVSGYMRPGDFLKKLTDSDVDELLQIAEDDENPRLDEILLISEMLATGEGLEQSKNVDGVKHRMNAFCAFLAIEGLSRKGLVKVYHENISFGEDFGNKTIVEKL
jgi:hypothetical protein